MPIDEALKPRLVESRLQAAASRQEEYVIEALSAARAVLRWEPGALCGEGQGAWGLRLCARISTWDGDLFRGVSGVLCLVQPWTDAWGEARWALVEELAGGKRVVVRGRSSVRDTALALRLEVAGDPPTVAIVLDGREQRKLGTRGQGVVHQARSVRCSVPVCRLLGTLAEDGGPALDGWWLPLRYERTAVREEWRVLDKGGRLAFWGRTELNFLLRTRWLRATRQDDESWFVGAGWEPGTASGVLGWEPVERGGRLIGGRFTWEGDR